MQVAVSLQLFDALETRHLNAAEIAGAVRADPRATGLLLHALVALGLLEKKSGLFSLNEISSKYLVSGSPTYLGGMILFDASLWSCWGDLEKAVKSGRPVRAADMYQTNPHETERFIAAMHSLVQARGDAGLLIRLLDFDGVRELLDVGSGPATYPIRFCRDYPDLRVTVFDLPGTLKITERYVRQAGLSDRIRLAAGDYRSDPLPDGCQMVFLSNIIHGEGSKENQRLMSKVFACLDSGGRIIIKDHILDDDLSHPPVGAIFSLLMLLTTKQGRCYSMSEVKSWLETAGFNEIKQLRLPYPLTSSLVIGTKS